MHPQIPVGREAWDYSLARMADLVLPPLLPAPGSPLCCCCHCHHCYHHHHYLGWAAPLIPAANHNQERPAQRAGVQCMLPPSLSHRHLRLGAMKQLEKTKNPVAVGHGVLASTVPPHELPIPPPPIPMDLCEGSCRSCSHHPTSNSALQREI